MSSMLRSSAACSPHPRLSVIVPCYNMGRYLGAAVESVLSQTDGDVETIVVDDGSADDSLAVAARFGAAIRYLTQPNGGVSRARNRGIEAAQGQWVAFLDADDFWLPHYWQTIGASVASARGVDVLCFGFRYAEPDGALTGLPVHPFPAGPVALRDLLVWNRILPHCAVVRRTALDQAGHFDPELSVTADWDMWIRLGLSGARFHALAAPLVAYRMTPGSMSKNLAAARDDGLRLIDKTFSRGDLPAELCGLYGEVRGRYLIKGAVEALAQNQTDAALSDFAQGVELTRRLLWDEAVHFGLACCRQPLPWQGTGHMLDLAHEARRVEEFLDALDRQLALADDERTAMYACSQRVFLKLAYMQHDRRQMWHHLRHWSDLRSGAWASIDFWRWAARTVSGRPTS